MQKINKSTEEYHLSSRHAFSDSEILLMADVVGRLQLGPPSAEVNGVLNKCLTCEHTFFLKSFLVFPESRMSFILITFELRIKCTKTPE